jgi:hypothetical protein
LRTRRKLPNPNQIIFFSDEKYFNQDGKTNDQNDKKLGSDHEDVPIVMHTIIGLAEGQPDRPLVEGNVASKLMHITFPEIFIKMYSPKLFLLLFL